LYPYPSRSLPVVLAVTARTAVPPPEGEPPAHLAAYARSALLASVAYWRKGRARRQPRRR
jgi:hypothetical protein